MRRVSFTAAAVAGVASAALVASAVVPASAAPIDRTAMGTRSLAAVLNVANPAFDNNWGDFDILTRAIATVLTEKPNSPVKKLVNGRNALTCFAPTDLAFKHFHQGATGQNIRREGNVFNGLVQYAGTLAAGLGGGYTAVDVVERVLLSHCTAGTINSHAAIAAAHARATLTMFSTSNVQLRMVHGQIALYDGGQKFRNPRVIVADINIGNKQIAHAINRVIVSFDIDPAPYNPGKCPPGLVC
ncbi:MAG: fasciclin domain-containing protein [Actinobacteria bacterium]|uniref:Unannotated protein n=1 Tax=freshwater metagenome TaxID=449393 RepID=A0A6J7L2H6_9ZZZZ|nr:fasciclin domain-containing protein [Actinomycetota bacterium]